MAIFSLYFPNCGFFSSLDLRKDIFSLSETKCVLFVVCVIDFLPVHLPAALDDAIEALSSGGAIELPLIRPQLTLMHDYSQALERFDDYEDDEGELRAESNLAEKFGELPSPKKTINSSLSLTRTCI